MKSHDGGLENDGTMERKRAVELSSMTLKGWRNNIVEAAFGNKDSYKYFPTRRLQGVEDQQQRLERAAGCACPRGKPAFIIRKEWEGALREKAEALWRFGGWETSNSKRLS